MDLSNIKYYRQMAQLVLDRLDADGGCTVSLSFGKTPRTGYQVGGVSWCLSRQRKYLWVGSIVDFIQAHAVQLHSDHGYHLGAWLKDDKVYLDVTETIYDREAAIEAAKDRGELAVWDNKRMEEVQVS